MFKRLPKDKAIAGLMRHAEREDIKPGEFGNEVNLTVSGKTNCHILAQTCQDRLINIYSSPIKRCMQTAEIFLPSAKTAAIIPTHSLGDPGVFIQDRDQAHQYFIRHGVRDIVNRLLDDQSNPSGFCYSTKFTVYQLVNFLLSNSVQTGISLFITHDAILSVVLGIFFAEIKLEELWPDYLETFFVWFESDQLCLSYRNHRKKVLWPISVNL